MASGSRRKWILEFLPEFLLTLLSTQLLQLRRTWQERSKRAIAPALVVSAWAAFAWSKRLWAFVGLQISSPLRNAGVKYGFPSLFGAWQAFCPCCKRPLRIELSRGPPPTASEARGKYAFLICLWGASREYLLGALVLGYSIKRTGSVHDRVCLYTDDVPEAHIQVLSRLWRCKRISHIDVAMEQLSFPDQEERFAKVFTKLNGMALVEYEKVLMMDIDLLVRSNIDDLFDLMPPAALRRGMNEMGHSHGDAIEGRCFFLGEDKSMPRWSWGQGTGINAGVMLWRPDQAVLDKMLAELTEANHPEHVKGNGPEQDYLSRYWADAPWTYISVEYNFQLHQMFFALHPDRANYAERSMLLQSPEKIRVVHFSGKPTAKPWHRVLDKVWEDFWPDRSRDAEYVERFAEEFQGYWLWVKRDPAKFEAQASENSWDMAGLELNDDGEFFRHFNNGREPQRLEIPEASSRGAMTLLSSALCEWFDIYQALQEEFRLDQVLAEPQPRSGVRAPPPSGQSHGPQLRHTSWRRHSGRNGWFVESDKANTAAPTAKVTVSCGISPESAFVSLRDSVSEMFEDSGPQVQGLYIKLAGYTATRHFQLPAELTDESLGPLHFWAESVPNGAIVMSALVGLTHSSLVRVLEMLAPLGLPQVPPPRSCQVLACVSTCCRDKPVNEEHIANGQDSQDLPCAHHASSDVAYASLLMDNAV